MFRLCVLVLLGVWHASAQTTTPAPGTTVDCATIGVNNCNKCDYPGMDCADCEIFAVMKEDFSGCDLCDLNCVDCQLDSTGTTPVCKLCAPGYIVKSDGSACVACGLYCGLCSFADQTETTTVCTQCAVSAGFTLGPYSKQCQYCGSISGCLTCTEGSTRALTCSACMAGYYMDSTGACSYCPANCATCVSNHQTPEEGKCSACEDGYIVETSDPTTCLSCQDECTKCTGTASSSPTLSTCSACEAGYYLDTNSALCVSCTFGCATCVDGSSCATCVTPGWFFDSSAKTCTACTYGCDTCKITNGVETCTKCSEDWGVQGSTQASCSLCPDNCLSCSNSPSECDDCDESNDYVEVVVPQGTFCALCPKNCDVVGGGCVDGGEGIATCDTCIDGFVAGTNAQGVSTCYPCPAHCDPTGCSFDAATYTTSCDSCDPDATSGLDYYAVNGACKSCAAQCTTCNDSPTCAGCLPSYFLDTTGANPKCSKCTANCLACVDGTASKCTSCASGYALSGASPNTCVACVSGCTCSTATPTCTGCLANSPTSIYVVASTPANGCVACGDPHCLDAAHCVAGTCSGCVQGYIINGANCVACDAHCKLGASCTYSAGAAQCAACVSGYYVTAGGKCAACSDSNCDVCTAASSGATCTTCNTGYQPAPTKCTKVPNMCDNGATYDSTDKSWTCNSCTDDNWAVIASGICAQGPANCAEAEVNPNDSTGMTVTCSVCDTGYGQNTKLTCDPCPLNCAVCALDITNKFQVCSTCNDDASENDNDCSQCPEGCTTCTNNNGEMYCTACDSDGWAPSPYSGECVACIGCSQCSQVSGVTSCLAGTCADGYGLDSDGSCTSCDVLTTVSLCSNCTDADESGNSICLDCSGTSVLNPWATSCDASDTLLSNNCLMPEFRAFECDEKSCNSPYSWIDQGPFKGFCGLNCAVCGDIDAGVFLPASECQNAAGNYSEAMIVDACWVSMITDSTGKQLFARGGTHQYNCTFAHQFEFYSSTNTKQTFACCQTGDNCNAQLQLDGTAGASAASFSLALLFASILVALRM